VNKRPEFLLEMYKQMMNDINRHILVVWQSAGVVAGSFAILALVEKRVIPLDVATALVLLICLWALAHLIDAGYWYNRNLCIIANIERQFLKSSDLKNIHYYFGEHRPNNVMLTHLIIQVYLCSGVAAMVLLYHFVNRIVPGLSSSFQQFEVNRALPYAVAVAGMLLLVKLWVKRNRDYHEFIHNSPGIAVDTSSVTYGSGHGFERKR